MYINDLIEHFVDFFKIKPSIDKLYNRKIKVLEAINQEINFRDLIIRTKFPNCFGESQNHTNQYIQSTEERLNAHIASIFNLANEDHRANYCEVNHNGDFTIQKGKENHITRLTMNEFSLYTSKPLSMIEYTKLNNDIQILASTLEPNVHVLLSSFAVTDKQGKILNMSMYIEGGASPKIHGFSKNEASPVDVNYGDESQLFTQENNIDVTTSESGDNIYTGSAFEVLTVGGAVYTQTIDVCLDHERGHSKEQIERRLFENAAPDEIIPDQIEQCVTSNWIDINKQSFIANIVLHADPVRSMLSDYHEKLGEKTLGNEEKKRIIPSQFPLMSIVNNAGGYHITKPPFGSDYVVEVLAERPAARYLPAYQGPVNQHNISVIERQIFSARQQDLTDGEKSAQRLSLGNTTTECISFRVEELKNKMLKTCRPNLWQRIFKTEEYRQKIEAKEIILKSMDFMNDAVKTQENSAVFLINPWKKDLAFKLRLVETNNVNNPFTQALSNDIHQSININLKKDLNCDFEQNQQNHI